MPALSFQKRFVAAVLLGIERTYHPEFSIPEGTRPKTQTIRLMRKHPFKVGDTLYFYYGMRTKACTKLGEAICESVTPIEIAEDGLRVNNIRGIVFGWEEGFTEGLAFQDGFETAAEMKSWFESTHGFPFVGQVISW